MEVNKNKIAVIDYVGLKGGNHYYSICLLTALKKLGIDTYFLSNLHKNDFTEGPEIKKVFPYELTKNIGGLMALIIGTIKSCIYLKRQKCKNVIYHSFESSIISICFTSIVKLFGLNLIAIVHDITSFEKGESSAFRNFQFNRLFDHIIVHNQFSFQSIADCMPKSNLAKVNVIKHGGHLDVINKHQKVEARKQLNLPEEETIALFFGQIKEVKGLDILIKAFPKSDHLKLYIAGKPWKDDFSKYLELINQNGLNEHVYKKIEYINEQDRDLLYSAADFVVLPYREIYQSGVLLMSMSFGLPVIASDLAANKEVIKDGENGLLFKTENPEDLKRVILETYDNKGLLKAIATNALKTIEVDYSWEIIANDYLCLLD